MCRAAVLSGGSRSAYRRPFIHLSRPQRNRRTGVVNRAVVRYPTIVQDQNIAGEGLSLDGADTRHAPDRRFKRRGVVRGQARHMDARPAGDRAQQVWFDGASCTHVDAKTFFVIGAPMGHRPMGAWSSAGEGRGDGWSGQAG